MIKKVLKIPLGIFKIIKCLIKTAVIFAFFNIPVVVITSVWVKRLKHYNPKTTPMILQSEEKFGRVLHWNVPERFLNRKLRFALISAEDQSFYLHKGISVKDIQRAVKESIKRKTLIGGSTISQQTARIMFLRMGDNIIQKMIRKWLELIIAVEMEHFLNKRKIINLYLNYAEWGKGVFGIGPASRYHYGKNISELTDGEIKRLMAILPNPKKLSPHQNNSFIKYRLKMINEFISNIRNPRINPFIKEANESASR